LAEPPESPRYRRRDNRRIYCHGPAELESPLQVSVTPRTQRLTVSSAGNANAKPKSRQRAEMAEAQAADARTASCSARKTYPVMIRQKALPLTTSWARAFRRIR